MKGGENEYTNTDNVKVLCARFNGAKHVLYEVPTY